MTTASLDPSARSRGAEGIPALTGIRAVAAFSIAAAHLYPPVDDLTLLGMPLFFTLSGFIIHYVYADTFAGSWRKAALAFAGARFSRIYPLYAALLAVALITSQMWRTLYHSANIPAIVGYVFACWTWLPLAAEGHSLQDWSYSISWSVPTEIFFYLAYALVFYRLAGIRRAKTCLIALIAFCIGAYAWFYLLFQTRDVWEAFALQHIGVLPARSPDFANSLYRWFLYISPYSRIFEFVGGCLTCQLFLLLRADGGLEGRPALARLSWPAAALIAAILLCYGYVAPRHAWLEPGDHSALSFFMNLHMNFLLAPFCYVLLFSLAVGGSMLSRLLSSGAAVLLGEISYSTYLGHPVAAYFILTSTISNLRHITIVEMLTVYLFSWMLYTSLEVPAKTMLRRLFAVLTLSRSPSGAAGRSGTGPDHRPAG
jgi:peptidoglycan/LPS O-acetylase OafA/YrhL